MYLSSKISSSLEFRIQSIEKTFDLHSENYTLLMIQQGMITVRQSSGMFRLAENDLFLISPDTPSVIRPDTGNQLLILEFSPSLLSTVLAEGETLAINSSLSDNKEPYRRLQSLLEQLALYYLQNGSKNQLLSGLYLLLDELEQHFLSPSASAPAEPESQTEARIGKIRAFIAQNYHLPVHLKDLADEMFLSEQYLSRFIRIHINSSFSQMLNDYRIERACQDMKLSSQAITEIAYNNGFSSIATFNRQFQKRFLLSPAAWRRQNRPPEQSETAIALSPSSADTADEPAENVTISFAEATPFTPCWKDTINIGIFSNLLSHAFMQDLIKCQSELHFSYVRFYNLFESDVVQDDTLLFVTLDAVFDQLMALRLRPFIELSFKPYKTSVFPDVKSAENLSFEPELSFETIKLLLLAFLHHAVRRYGLEEVSAWRFEVWAKHDEQLCYLETPEEYLDRFGQLRSVILSVVPDAAVGGPGFNLSASGTFFTGCLSAMQKRKLRPDFLSVYIYFYGTVPTDPDADAHASRSVSDFPMIPSDPDYLQQKYRAIQALIHQYFRESPPLFITEFNSSLYNETYVISSAFQGAFLFRNLIRMTLYTPCLAFWHLSDFSGEPVSDPRFFIPGMGLLGRQQIPKPSWHVLHLLSWLCTNYVFISDHAIAATDGSRHYQFAVCNYTHYRNTYCFTHQNQPTLMETYDIFEEKDAMRISLTMKDLPDGMYSLRSIRVGRSCGSFLDQLTGIFNQISETGADPEEILINVDPYELSYYRQLAEPGRTCRYIRVQNGVFSAAIDLEPHDVLLIDLKQKLL